MLHVGPFYIVPALHHTMEVAVEARKAFLELQPDCVAVELPEQFQGLFCDAVARLPDISVILTKEEAVNEKLIYLVEPCDASFEALRSGIEAHIPVHCIDLDVVGYPEMYTPYPDPYAIHRIGLDTYYEAYREVVSAPQDEAREVYMAKRLRELSFSYEKILVVIGMSHVQAVLKHLQDPSYPSFTMTKRSAKIATLTEESCRQVLAEYGWITKHYEEWREENNALPDRQKLILHLLKGAKAPYEEETRSLFPSYGLSSIMKFGRNYAHLKGRLLPSLYEVIAACKGCLDHNFAYEVWKLATEYPFLRNVDNLEELNLSIEEIWGGAKKIRFHKKEPSRKLFGERLKKDRSKIRFFAPNPFSICSYPPEDAAIESFGNWLKKRGVEQVRDDAVRTIPFTTSLEDGVDVKETIRHMVEKKLYVKTRGKPPGGVGSLVVIFDEDNPQKTNETFEEKYPWTLSWLGENDQESDMAFYATPLKKDIIGPGIARCEYGGFMMSYPPRRLLDVWRDPDYERLRSKSEVLLAAAIDYAVKPLVIYVAEKPPQPILKRYAEQFGKRILFMPLSQFSAVTLKKLRVFHVMDSHDRRGTAEEYITT